MDNARSSNRQSLAVLLVVLLGIAVLALALGPRLLGSNSAAPQALDTPTPQAPDTPTPQAGGTVTSSAYPKMGHAPDYSWVAGQVAFTRIQGGCIFILTAPAPTPAPGSKTQSSTPIGPIVSTAVGHDVSPPLTSITPLPPSPPPVSTPAEGASFVPGGSGWDPSKVKDGDFVVVFGHLAGPNDPREMCPGGEPYIIDRLQLNP